MSYFVLKGYCLLTTFFRPILVANVAPFRPQKLTFVCSGNFAVDSDIKRYLCRLLLAQRPRHLASMAQMKTTFHRSTGHRSNRVIGNMVTAYSARCFASKDNAKTRFRGITLDQMLHHGLQLIPVMTHAFDRPIG